MKRIHLTSTTKANLHRLHTDVKKKLRRQHRSSDAEQDKCRSLEKRLDTMQKDIHTIVEVVKQILADQRATQVATHQCLFCGNFLIKLIYYKTFLILLHFTDNIYSHHSSLYRHMKQRHTNQSANT